MAKAVVAKMAAAALAVCLLALALAVADAHDGRHDMTPGMVMPPGMDMAPSPSDHNHGWASASTLPSMAAALLAAIVCLLAHGKRI
ncbi:hypothetical protein NL676_032431 [Syzygium grande]|nr:hypothetical protein NL676_032431 [Syzygium grande]